MQNKQEFDKQSILLELLYISKKKKQSDLSIKHNKTGFELLHNTSCD